MANPRFPSRFRSWATPLIVLAGLLGGPREAAPVVDANLLDRRPVEVSCPKPDYPPGFRESAQKGLVALELLIDPAGRVAEAGVMASTDPRLSAVSVDAALKWTYKPPTKSGEPVYARLRVAIGFGPGEYGTDEKAEFKPPVVTYQERPQYPFALRLSGIRGEVVVAFTVDPQGRVIQPVVIQSSHPDFEAPSIEAILNWTFKPGSRNGQAVYTRMEVPVIFELTFPDGRFRASEAWRIPDRASTKLPADLQYDQPPHPLYIGAPVYPYDLLIEGVKGKARIAFAVDPLGRTQDIRVDSATKPEFGSAAAAMVAAWRFDPAMKAGKPSWCVLEREQDFSRSDDDFPLSDSALRLLGELKKVPCPILAAGGLDVPLKGRYQPSPIVPASVGTANSPASATISFIVDRAGHAQLPRIVSCTNEDFAWAAATAVGRWQFNAPTRKGRPVDVQVTIPIAFKPQSPGPGPQAAPQ